MDEEESRRLMILQVSESPRRPMGGGFWKSRSPRKAKWHEKEKQPIERAVKPSEARINLTTWLNRWDNATKKRRKMILQEFIEENQDQTLQHIEQKFGGSVSLVLSRIVSSLRLGYIVGFALTLHIQAIRLIVCNICDQHAPNQTNQASHQNVQYTHEILESGVFMVFLELLTMPTEDGVSERDKKEAVRLVREVCCVSPLPKQVLGECNGLEAVRECMEMSNDRELHLACMELLVEVNRANPSFAVHNIHFLGKLIRHEEPLVKWSAAKTVRAMLQTEESSFSHSEQTQNDILSIEPMQSKESYRIQRLTEFVAPAVALLQGQFDWLQQEGVELVKAMIDQDGLFGSVVRHLVLLVYSTPSLSTNGTSGYSTGVNGNLLHPALCVLGVFDHLIESCSDALLSSMCSQGLTNVIISSMMNIHSYDIQKLATKLCRDLSIRFHPAKHDFQLFLGHELLERLLESSVMKDGQIIREFIRNVELYNQVSQVLKQRGWDIGFRGSTDNQKQRQTETKQSMDTKEQDRSETDPNPIREDNSKDVAEDRLDRDDNIEEGMEDDDDNAASAASSGMEDGGQGEEQTIEQDEQDEQEESDFEEEEEEEEEEEDDDVLPLGDSDKFMGGLGRRKGGDAEDDLSNRSVVVQFPLTMKQLQLRESRRYGDGATRNGKSTATLVRDVSTSSIQSTDSMSSLMSAQLPQVHRKEEFYVPSSGINPGNGKESMMFAQFLGRSRETISEEERQTLEYIKGLPAKETPLDPCRQDEEDKEVAEDLIHRCRVEVVKVIPLKYLPENVAATYVDASDRPMMFQAMRRASMSNKTNKQEQAPMTKELKEKRRQQKLMEIMQHKQEMRDLRMLGKERVQAPEQSKDQSFQSNHSQGYSKDVLLQMAIRKQQEFDRLKASKVAVQQKEDVEESLSVKQQPHSRNPIDVVTPSAPSQESDANSTSSIAEERKKVTATTRKRKKKKKASRQKPNA